MDQTRNPDTAPEMFAQKAAEFFSLFQFDIFTTKKRAEEFINALDKINDNFRAQILTTESTYSEEMTLLLGSAFGEALRLVLDGQWKYDTKQERWVISRAAQNGDLVDMNVFHKIEKCLSRDSDDSISYYFGMLKSVLAGEMEF